MSTNAPPALDFRWKVANSGTLRPLAARLNDFKQYLSVPGTDEGFVVHANKDFGEALGALYCGQIRHVHIQPGKKDVYLEGKEFYLDKKDFDKFLYHYQAVIRQGCLRNVFRPPILAGLFEDLEVLGYIPRIYPDYRCTLEIGEGGTFPPGRYVFYTESHSQCVDAGGYFDRVLSWSIECLETELK